MTIMHGEIGQVKYLLQEQQNRFLVDNNSKKRAYALLKKVDKEHKIRLFNALQSTDLLDQDSSIYIRENEDLAVLIIEPLFDLLTTDAIEQIKSIIIQNNYNLKNSQINQLTKNLK